MKSTVAPYASRAICLRIVCQNGTTIRLARYPYDMTMSNGQVYKADSGYDVTSYQATTDFSPSAVDLEGFVGVAGITRDAVASGVFDGARVYCFACDFLSPVEDYEPIMLAILGKTRLQDDKYLIEKLGIVDVLNQSIGRVVGPACDKTLGSQSYAGCMINLAAITVTGALTSVTSSSSFADSGRGEAADYFGLGTIVFTSGANVGLRAQQIKSFSSGAIVTYEPFYYTPQVGDTYSMVPGCRKSLDVCRDKFNNVINFGGWPYKPPESVYISRGTK